MATIPNLYDTLNMSNGKICSFFFFSYLFWVNFVLKAKFILIFQKWETVKVCGRDIERKVRKEGKEKTAQHRNLTVNHICHTMNTVVTHFPCAFEAWTDLYTEIEYECMRVCAIADVELKSVIVFYDNILCRGEMYIETPWQLGNSGDKMKNCPFQFKMNFCFVFFFFFLNFLWFLNAHWVWNLGC